MIIRGYSIALQKALETCNAISRVINIDNREELREIVMAASGTKFSSRWGLKVRSSRYSIVYNMLYVFNVYFPLLENNQIDGGLGNRCSLKSRAKTWRLH